jgi:hypothetical protein
MRELSCVISVQDVSFVLKFTCSQHVSTVSKILVKHGGLVVIDKVHEQFLEKFAYFEHSLREIMLDHEFEVPACVSKQHQAQKRAFFSVCETQKSLVEVIFILRLAHVWKTCFQLLRSFTLASCAF